MESIQPTLVTRIINDTLALEPLAPIDAQASQLAKALIDGEAATLRAPVKQDRLSKFMRDLRDTLCSDKTRVYYDLKETLTELSKGLQSGEITFSVQDAKREKTLIKHYHGDGKEVFAKAASQLHKAIAQLGLSESKARKLQALVASISDSLNTNPAFRQEFQENKKQAELVDECLKELAKPGVDLSTVETNLASVVIVEGTHSSAFGEKLKNAREILEVKKSITGVSTKLKQATTVEELFDIAGVAIKSCDLDPERKEQFTKGVEHELKLSVGKMVHAFEKEGLKLVAKMAKDPENFFRQSEELKEKFRNIVLTEDVDITEELSDAKKLYHETAAVSQKVQSSYLRAFKKQLKFEAARYSAYIEKEPSLQRLAACKHNVELLFEIVESCERATSSDSTPEVEELVDAIQEQLLNLEETITRKINEQAEQQQKEIQAELARLDAELQKNNMLKMIGNQEHTIVQLTQEPSEKLSITALGVALSALKWVPILGQPVAELGEAMVDRAPNFIESGISTTLATALLTGYVVYSGVKPMEPGGFIFSGLKVAPLLAPNAVAYLTRQMPPGNVLPRPLALALGMVTAGATAYVFYRGPLNIASDVFWYGVNNIPGAAAAVGGAAFEVTKKATVYTASSAYNAVSAKVHDLGMSIITQFM